MTDIDPRAFALCSEQEAELSCYYGKNANPDLSRIIEYFSCFYTEINLEEFVETVSGYYVLALERANRAHAFLELVLELLEVSSQMDGGSRPLLVDNFWTDHETFIGEFLLENYDDIFDIDPEIKLKIDIMRVEFEMMLKGRKSDHEDMRKRLNVMTNACLYLWGIMDMNEQLDYGEDEKE
jgi:hypothetical protein